MKKKIIKPISAIRGMLIMPGDKSVSHRAVIMGSIARGMTTVRNMLHCDDCNYTIEAFRSMGVRIEIAPDGDMLIEGKGLRGLARPPQGEIFLGESGTSMRILPGVIAGQDFDVTFTGGPSLSKRPMKRIIDPLKKMGVVVKASKGGFPPLTVRERIKKPAVHTLKVASAQVKSCILLAGLYLPRTTIVIEPVRSRDHTERMLRSFGAEVLEKDRSVSITGGKELTGKSVAVPGDISSAAFFMAAAVLLPGSRITLPSVGVNRTRSGVLDVLTRMGASVEIINERGSPEPIADITVSSSPIHGVTIEKEELPRLIDEVPIIIVLAARAAGTTVIEGAHELRVKETDRIESMVSNLRRMGAKITAKGDDIIVEGVPTLRGASIEAFGDHRTAMSLSVAALSAEGKSELDDPECVSKSFPGFFEVLNKVSG
ncbi:MAG: 3-phosphoshikimate 1-carboxyvinyltransferase [Candidatus Omnitrophota bacterium]